MLRYGVKLKKTEFETDDEHIAKTYKMFIKI